VANVPALPHFSLGRRKLIRREWLEAWLEDYKSGVKITAMSG
jgi:hypothetical protein